MMLKVFGAIRRLMGWCPMAGSMRTDLAVRPATTAVPGGEGGISPTGPGWWHRYHNQLLVAAVAFSAAAAAAFLLIEDVPGHPTVWTSLAIGVGAFIGFLLGCRKQYARVAAGEFIRANMSRRQRVIRNLSMPVAAVLLVAFMGYFVLSGMPGWIVGFTLALSLAVWAQYGVTILWERRHRMIVIAEKGSMYTLDTAIQEEMLWR